MTLDRQRRCAFPPHPETPAPPARTAGLTGDSAVRRLARWARHAPAERMPLLAVPAIWTAAGVAHAAGMPGWWPAAATAVATLAGFGIGRHRSAGTRGERLTGGEVAAITAITGVWVTAAVAFGPLAGPWHLLTLTYAAGTVGGYAWLRRHPAVRAARARRDQAAAWQARKTAWHSLAPGLGLHGSHLLAYEDTLLGDAMLIDTRGTGRRASQISGRDVAERLGEIEMIPAGRIDVTPDAIPGRLRVSVRRKDPWAKPLAHPAIDPASPYAGRVPVPATCHVPVVIGADPETGRPLPLTLWDPHEGGKVIMITAKKGSGKTVLMSCIRERVTACTDAILLQVNLSMVRHDRRWAPLAAANALGRDQAGQARRILQFTASAAFTRSEAGGDDRLITPGPGQPLIVLVIDEIDMVAADPVCRELLARIASKCRNEAITLIAAGQRATAAWVGGADLRANVDIAVLGRFARRGEARKATGDDTELPDMGEYGEGHPGVFLVTELGGGGAWQRGRVFNLDEPAAIDQIVTTRAATRPGYVLEPALAALAGDWHAITTSAGHHADHADHGGMAGVVVMTGLAGGSVIQGSGQIRARTSHARALAAELAVVPQLPPEMEQHAARLLAERQAQALAINYGDITVPDQIAAALLPLLAAPGGTTSSRAAAAIGRSRPAAHRYLSALRAAGIARLDGSGHTARFRLANPGEPRAVLTVVPPAVGSGDAGGTVAGHGQ